MTNNFVNKNSNITVSNSQQQKQKLHPTEPRKSLKGEHEERTAEKTGYYCLVTAKMAKLYYAEGKSRQLTGNSTDMKRPSRSTAERNN